jgi:uncharacterized protein YegP (UPF0339 family)
MEESRMYIEYYKSGWGIFSNWKWRLVKETNTSEYGKLTENIAYGSGFNTRANVNKSINDIIELLKSPNHTIIIYYSGKLKPSWKWKLIAKNGRTLASDRGFVSEEEAST